MTKSRFSKVLLVAGSVLIGTMSFNATSNAGSIAIGAAGTVAYVNTEATEKLKGEANNVQADERAELGAVPSVFAQYTFGDDGFVIGIERNTHDVKLVNEVKDRFDALAASARYAVTQTIDVAVTDYTTYYVETPGLGSDTGGIYLVAGMVQATIETNEKLGTGSSYPDIDVDGVKYGIGFKTGTAGGILFKIEGTYTEFDAISVNSTGSDTATTITSPGTEIGAVKLAVGYAF